MTGGDPLAREAARLKQSLESFLGDARPDPRARDDLKRVLDSLDGLEDHPPRDARDGTSIVVSFRLRDEGERDELKTRARQASTSVSDFIRQKVLDQGNDEKPGHEPAAATRQLVEDLQFLFQFFQQNARNLEVNDMQKQRLKDILQRVQVMNHEA